jgi:hypothetical protein
MLTIAMATLLFLAASGLLYLRWATMREPTCIFIVEAPSSLRGAEVTVDNAKLVEPHTVVIGRGERFAIPFYLDYGLYSVRVTLNGATMLETQVELTPTEPAKKIDLSQFPAPLPMTTTTAPATSRPSSALPPMSIPREGP